MSEVYMGRNHEAQTVQAVVLSTRRETSWVWRSLKTYCERPSLPIDPAAYIIPARSRMKGREGEQPNSKESSPHSLILRSEHDNEG